MRRVTPVPTRTFSDTHAAPSLRHHEKHAEALQLGQETQRFQKFHVLSSVPQVYDKICNILLGCRYAVTSILNNIWLQFHPCTSTTLTIYVYPSTISSLLPHTAVPPIPRARHAHDTPRDPARARDREPALVRVLRVADGGDGSGCRSGLVAREPLARRRGVQERAGAAERRERGQVSGVVLRTGRNVTIPRPDKWNWKSY